MVGVVAVDAAREEEVPPAVAVEHIRSLPGAGFSPDPAAGIAASGDMGVCRSREGGEPIAGEFHAVDAIGTAPHEHPDMSIGLEHKRVDGVLDADMWTIDDLSGIFEGTSRRIGDERLHTAVDIADEERDVEHPASIQLDDARRPEILRDRVEFGTRGRTQGIDAGVGPVNEVCAAPNGAEPGRDGIVDAAFAVDRRVWPVGGDDGIREGAEVFSAHAVNGCQQAESEGFLEEGTTRQIR